MKHDAPILHRPIPELGFSREFCLITEQLGYFTLADMVEQRATYLAKLPGFNKHMLVEYISFLEDHDLGDLIG